MLQVHKRHKEISVVRQILLIPRLKARYVEGDIISGKRGIWIIRNKTLFAFIVCECKKNKKSYSPILQ